MAAESDKKSSGKPVIRGAFAGCLIVVVLFLFLGLLDCGMPWFFTNNKSQQISAQNNASSIAKCYYVYGFCDTVPHVVSAQEAGGDVSSFALFLAAKGGMNLADPWFIKTDDALGTANEWPRQVADLSDPAHPVIDPLFAKTGPKSWAMVVNMPDAKTLESRASTYPVLWTRGLGATTWKKDSPWNGEGGHVAFLDGHTIWIKSTIDADTGVGIFKDYVTGEPTADIRKAIGPGAVVLEDR